MGSTPGAPVGSSLTLPTSTDLTVGKGNLDRFVERRIEEFSNELTTPTIVEDESKDTDQMKMQVKMKVKITVKIK